MALDFDFSSFDNRTPRNLMFFSCSCFVSRVESQSCRYLFYWSYLTELFRSTFQFWFTKKRAGGYYPKNDFRDDFDFAENTKIFCLKFFFFFSRYMKILFASWKRKNETYIKTLCFFSRSKYLTYTPCLLMKRDFSIGFGNQLLLFFFPLCLPNDMIVSEKSAARTFIN